MLTRLFESRVARILASLLALVLVIMEGIDFATYSASEREQLSLRDEQGPGQEKFLSAAPQSAQATSPPSTPTVVSGEGRPPRVKRVDVGSASPATAPEYGTQGQSAEQIACSADASESQISKLLEQIARVKLQSPDHTGALIKLEEELRRLSGVCVEQLQQSVKHLCATNPDVEEAFRALRGTLPMLIGSVVRDPCKEDLGTLLNVLDRLHPEHFSLTEELSFR